MLSLSRVMGHTVSSPFLRRSIRSMLWRNQYNTCQKIDSESRGHLLLLAHDGNHLIDIIHVETTRGTLNILTSVRVPAILLKAPCMYRRRRLIIGGRRRRWHPWSGW